MPGPAAGRPACSIDASAARAAAHAVRADQATLPAPGDLVARIEAEAEALGVVAAEPPGRAAADAA